MSTFIYSIIMMQRGNSLELKKVLSYLEKVKATQEHMTFLLIMELLSRTIIYLLNLISII